MRSISTTGTLLIGKVEMAAPQTSSRPNVHFDSNSNGDQTGEVTSVSPTEKPKRKSQNVTQKYDRKFMRVRLGIEEWMDEQLRMLYECAVSITGELPGLCILGFRSL